MILPSYLLHKVSGQAIVTLGGRDVYLGTHGSPDSQAEYRRVLAEVWFVSGQTVMAHPGGVEHPLTMAELMAAVWRKVEAAYPARSLQAIRRALSHLRSVHAHTLAWDSHPLSIRAIRRSLIDTADDEGTKVCCRRSINHYCAEVRQVFKWGVGDRRIVASERPSTSVVVSAIGCLCFHEVWTSSQLRVTLEN